MNRTYQSISWCLFIAVLGILWLAPAITCSPAWAQDDTAVEETIPLGIAPLSNRTALLSFPLSVYPFNEPNKMPTIRLQELSELTIVLEDKTDGGLGLDILEDFLPLSTSAINSGLAVYKESEAKRGFNYSVEDQSKDLPIDLSEAPIIAKDPVIPGRFTIKFRPIPGSANVQLPFFKDQFADFYVVARTSLNLRQGDRFEAYIPADGIKIRDNRQTLPKDTLYPERFPGEYFADLNPNFTVPALFEGDIVTIVNLISETENTNRIDASSEAKTILGVDFVGREDEGYFLEEVRVNFLGLNLGAIARLIDNMINQGASIAGMEASSGFGSEQVTLHPSFFFSPWFYNTPFDMETGAALTTTAPGDGKTEIPLTMPLDFYGFPLQTFMIGADDPNNHYTGYVSYGPRQPGAFGLTPRVVTQDIFRALQANAEGGIFLYRELGGTRGQYDTGVDHLLNLDPDSFRVEAYEIDPALASDSTTPLNGLLQRLLPGVTAGSSGKAIIPMLFGDDNLATLLMGVVEVPDPPKKPPRPAFGSLACVMDEDCRFFDLMINVLRPYMGLTEGQIRYLFEYTEANGRTNSQDLFDYDLVQGFTFVLPVAKSNAYSDLAAPSVRTGANTGSDIYVAIRSSDNLRNLDSLIPFIQPKDIKVGTNVKEFAQGKLDNVQSLQSVSSIGYGRPETSKTYSVIGRPKPRFLFQDLTQPGEGELAGNNNILYDVSQSSPPKAVIGIDANDFGQNPLLVDNHQTFSYDVFDTFFTESTVLGEVQVDFIPGSRSTVFNPLILSAIPTTLGINVEFSRVVSNHSIALYYDDDTPSGNGSDDDGDGLYDEEWYNLQDDDGDGLIDEDLGDDTPAGINGIFDSMDRYLPADRDRFGYLEGVETATYVYAPNNITKYQDYITAIQTDTNPLDAVMGCPIPLNVSEGSYFGELDLRVLNMGAYRAFRSTIFSSYRMSGSPYNQGMFNGLEPRTGVLDLLAMMGGDPYYPDSLFIETPDTGEKIWMINLTSDSEDTIGVVPDPKGDARESFALSLNAALRIPHPSRGFVRVGWTPMVIGVGEGVQDPQGESLVTAPYHQFGFDISLADANAISTYLRGVMDTLSSAYESAQTAIDDYNTAVAEAEATAAEADPPGEPEYPDPPEATEVQLPNPLSSLNIRQFLETMTYDTNYQYLVQIPDENFGPLAGNDFYVVLRSAPEASVGESFRVRIRSGQRNAVLTTTDADTGTTTTVARPQGGIGYYSYLETSYNLTANKYPGVSKNQITTSEIYIQSANVAPSLTFTSPSSVGTNIANDDFEFDIIFTAQDPDNVAEVQLYVDTDNLNYDGQFIPGAILREGYATGFKLNMLEDIEDFDPTLSYYIYARLDDGVNPPVYVYTDAPISTTVSSSNNGGSSGENEGGGSSQVITGDLTNRLDYIKLKNDGTIYSLGEAPSFTKINATTSVIDIEVTPTFSGVVSVQVNGKVQGSGDLGKLFSKYLQPNGSFAFPAGQVNFYKNDLAGGSMIVDPTDSQISIEHARDVEVDFTNGAIYVLDGDGDMLFLGNANLNLRPEPMGIDLYRDMELGPDGKQMYFLTGNGVMQAVGNATVPGWSNMVRGDVYRDLSLRVRGGVINNIVITDADGNLTVLGSDSTAKNTIVSLKPETEIPAGTIRQVKLFSDTDEIVMLMQGSGEPIFLTKGQTISKPTDRLIFSDDPGLDDDRIVDTETTSINLQSVVTSTRDIIDAFANESTERIMAYVSPAYKDRSGATAENLRQSLNSFFQFFEVQSFAESRTALNSFTITNQGDTITAQVKVDASVFYPYIFYYLPTLDTSSTTGETFAEQLLVQQPPTFDQTFSIREVSDGRGWVIDLYEIRNYGRKALDMVTQEELEYEDYTYLLSLTNNRRMGTYVTKNAGIDDTLAIKLDINEANPLEPYNLLAVIREPYLTRNTQPPAFEFSMYTGSFISLSNYNTINFVFNRNTDGSVRVTSMNLRQIFSTNESQFLTVDTTGSGQQALITQLDGTQLNQSFGFSFSKRGPVKAVFQGDADITMPDATTLQAAFPRGGIMALPAGTDIFSINPGVLIGQTITRTTVKINPFDPDAATLSSNTMAGYVATYAPGRAYFVIAADGKHYGFIQVPSEAANLSTDSDPPITMFDFRYEDSFVLPANF